METRKIKMNIYRVKSWSQNLAEAITRLLPQLSSNATPPSQEELSALLADENTHLIVAEIDNTIAGMLSLVIVNIPTGRKAWIEDVVVDGAFRGQNIGSKLVEYAKQSAKDLEVKKLYLTSNPSRKAAHALYKKCGFETYDTTLFRIKS
jgi:ribosomal protein S18 acetylase RimI-like enzyme